MVIDSIFICQAGCGTAYKGSQDAVGVTLIDWHTVQGAAGGRNGFDHRIPPIRKGATEETPTRLLVLLVAAVLN